MLATSRQSLASLTEVLDSRRNAPDFADVSAQLLFVADLLGKEKALLNTLADAGQPTHVRTGLVERLLASRLNGSAMEIVRGAAVARWAHAGDLVDAFETLGAQAAFAVALADSSLDAVENELFRFGRTVEASAQLQMALTNPASPAVARVGIVKGLLAGRTAAATQQILEHLVTNLRGRRLDIAIDDMVDLAASTRKKVVAEVRSAVALTDTQMQRLATALTRMSGRDVHVNVVIDPTVVGGASVRIGEEIIDGTIASRLEQAQRALIAD